MVIHISNNTNYIKLKNGMNFDVSFYNSCGGKMIKVAYQVLQGCVATYGRILIIGQHLETL